MTVGPATAVGVDRSSRPAPAVGSAPAVVAAVAVALAVGAAWATYGRDDWSLDEGYTATEAQLPFRALAGLVRARELNGSLHTLLIWILSRVAGGTSTALLRGPSVVAVVVAAAVLFGLVRRLGGATRSGVAGVVAVVFLVANPLVAQDTMTGRTYALTVALVVVSLFQTVRLTSGTGSRWAPFGWGASAGLLLYAHFLTAAVVLAEIVWLVVYHRAGLWVWVRGVAVAAVLALPVALFLLSPGARRGQLPPAPARSLHDYVSGVLPVVGAGPGTPRVWQLAVVLVVVVLCGCALRSARTRRHAVLGLLVAALPVVSAVLASRAVPSVFEPMYLVIATPGLALAVALGASTLPLRTPVAAAAGLGTVLLFGAGGTALTAAHIDPGGDRSWTRTAAYLAASGAHGQQVVTLVPFEGQVARRYLQPAGLALVPPRPTTTDEVLAQSVYTDRVRFPGVLRPGPVWVVSAMSPDFVAAVHALAAESGLRVELLPQQGFVAVAELVPDR